LQRKGETRISLFGVRKSVVWLLVAEVAGGYERPLV